MPMYKVSMEEARWGAVFPGKFVPVLTFEGKCSGLRAKIAHISGHLPNGKGATAAQPSRTALAPTRLANDARASTASQSGKSQGEAPPHRVHTAPVPCIIAEGGREEQVYVK